MCLSATMPPPLARFLHRRLPPDHADVSLHGGGGSNVGGAVEHLAMSCHPNDLVATVMSAVEAYARGGGPVHYEQTVRGGDGNGTNRGGVAGDEEEKNLTGGGEGEGNSKSGGVTGQAIVFVETKVAAEQLSGTLAIAYEVRFIESFGVSVRCIFLFDFLRLLLPLFFFFCGFSFLSNLSRVHRQFLEGNEGTDVLAGR